MREGGQFVAEFPSIQGLVLFSMETLETEHQSSAH
jgi:hypothetical protein